LPSPSHSSPSLIKKNLTWVTIWSIHIHVVHVNNRHQILIWNFMIKCNIMINHYQIWLELVAAASNPYEICISKVNVGMYLLNSQEKNDDKVHFTN
jgi:hypothetical protein